MGDFDLGRSSVGLQESLQDESQGADRTSKGRLHKLEIVEDAFCRLCVAEEGT